MSTYEIIYILTNIIHIYTINKLFEIFFDKKDCNTKVRNIVYIIFYFVLGIIIFITRLPIVILIINIAFMFIVSLTYKSSLKKKIISISLIYALMLCTEILFAAMFGFFEFSPIKDSTYNSITLLIIVKVILLAVAYLINRYKNSLKKDYNIPKIYYPAFFIVLFGTLYLFILAIANENINMRQILISGTVLIMVNITIIVIDEKIYNAIISENEKKLLTQQAVVYENQMEIINQSSENIRLLKHDFKNHLIMMSNLYKNGKTDEIEPYIDKILGNIEDEVLVNSSNFVIDSILNFKLMKIKDSDIKLCLNINVPTSTDILANDLTVVLANLLDNLIIVIKNSYNGKIICENGNLKTTKSFKRNHGLGIKSIEKVIEKYDGDMRFNYTNDIFSISVIIPY